MFALANAIMYGSVTVAVRGMTKTESANTLLMWQMVTLTVFHSFLLVFGFKLPTPTDAGMLIAGGFANAAGQYLWTRSLHLAPTTAITPVYYFLMVWSLAIGLRLWGTMKVMRPNLCVDKRGLQG